MKKLRIIIIILLSCISTFSYSQSKTEFGVTTEGSLLIFGNIPHYFQPKKNTLSAGIGIYASRNIAGKLSADLGLMYRFKQMKEYYDISPNTYDSGGYGADDGYSNNGSPYSHETVEGWKTFPLHYVVAPVHLQYLVFKDLFVRGGIEASWLTNYDTGIKKTEYNWTVGWGSQKHKLKWSVNYIRGFKDVWFYNGIYETEIANVKYSSVTFYRNQMLQLNLSYPIWQKK